MNLITFSITLFLILNPFGATPLILSIIQGETDTKQKWILARETFFASIILIIFMFMGSSFLSVLGVDISTMKVTGGLLLLIIGLQLMFGETSQNKTNSDSLLVPIAFPSIAGPGALTIVMTQAHSGVLESLEMGGAILVVCFVFLIILETVRKGSEKISASVLTAISKLGALITLLIAISMILNGFKIYFEL